MSLVIKTFWEDRVRGSAILHGMSSTNLTDPLDPTSDPFAVMRPTLYRLLAVLQELVDAGLQFTVREEHFGQKYAHSLQLIVAWTRNDLDNPGIDFTTSYYDACGYADCCQGSQLKENFQYTTAHLPEYIAVGLNAGLRKSGMFSLTWSDLDFERKEIRVRKSKGKKFRVVPMNETLVNVLKHHPRHIKSPYLFHNADGSPCHDTRRGFESALNNAGLPRIRIHDMRHSFISNLLMQGVDIKAVKELAGHRDISTTMKYAHLMPEHLEESVEKLKWESGSSTVVEESMFCVSINRSRN